MDIDDCPNSEKLTSEGINELTKLYGSLLDKSSDNVDAVFTEVETSFAVSNLDPLMQILKTKLSDHSRTSKLWWQFMCYVETVRMFVRAECLSDLSLHELTIS